MTTLVIEFFFLVITNVVMNLLNTLSINSHWKEVSFMLRMLDIDLGQISARD